MGGQVAPDGYCCLCGKLGPLTFEHIPPRRCFNGQMVSVLDIHTLALRRRHNPNAPPTRYRAGLGAHALCEGCNGKTAKWYGDAFASWTTQAMQYLEKFPPGYTGRLAIPFTIEPLKVAKQIAVMMVAVSGPGGLVNAEMRRFVLSREQQLLPPGCSIFCYFVPLQVVDGTNNAAVTANGFKMKLGQGIQVAAIAEVAIPPLGYCMVPHVGNWRHEVKRRKMCDITWFADYAWGVKRTLHIDIPVRGLPGPLPFAT